jgi:hypothetical protein
MKISTSECYVIVAWASYCGAYLATEDIHQDRLEAEREVKELRSHSVVSNNNIIYKVEVLSNYLNEVRREVTSPGYELVKRLRA